MLLLLYSVFWLLLLLVGPVEISQQCRYAAATGFLGHKAFYALKLTSMLWKPDVREHERINKCLKLFWSRTPNGTKELCSARAGLRHQLGPAQNDNFEGKSLKWSTVKPAVQKLTTKLLSSWHEKDDVLTNTERWSPATAPSDHPCDAQVKRLMPKLNPNLSLVVASLEWNCDMGPGGL